MRFSVRIFAAAVVLGSCCVWAGALKDYVYASDPAYAVEPHSVIKGRNCEGHVVRLTSQQWHSEETAPGPWTHWLTIIVPDALVCDKAMLFITGGKVGTAAPKNLNGPWCNMAVKTKSVVAILQQVPNQPARLDNQERLTEDKLVAASFQKYIETGDGTWPVLCAMVKSAVRAMDAVQEYCSRNLPEKHSVHEFVVSGISKRGWTTWLTGAVDPRVCAIAPQVIDVLNMGEQMKLQEESFGGYSDQVGDYSERGLQQMLDTPEGQALLKIVDPYSYLDDLGMPKLILLGAGDDYWATDASSLYFHDLKGPSLIRYEPNMGHKQFRNQGPQLALLAFYDQVLRGEPFPDLEFHPESDGAFKLESRPVPEEVRMWSATSDQRDFRETTIGKAWTDVPLQMDASGCCKGHIETPSGKYVAYFVECTYASPLGFRYSLTTPMQVFPGLGKTN